MFILAIILVIAWIIGFFGTKIGPGIHFLLAIAIVAIILGYNQGQKIA